MPQHLQAANLPFRSCALHLSFIIYHFFAVDIPNLKPILNPMCIGTHSAVARQASPKEAPPPLPRFFHHSKFKILNSPPLSNQGQSRINQGQSGKKIENFIIIPPRFVNRPGQNPVPPDGKPVKGEIRPRPNFPKIAC
jgi:hypothetical protein